MSNSPVISLEILSKRLDQIEKSANEGYSRLSDYVGKSIDIQALILAVFSLAVTIISILVSIYVQRSVEKATKAKNDADEALKDVKEVEIRILELLRQLNDEPNRVYNIIQNQQISYIFERLDRVPEDIANVHSILASSPNLEKKYFLLLKQLFLRCQYDQSEIRRDITSAFVNLMIQHFPLEVNIDQEIKRYIEVNFQHIIQELFPIDLIVYLEVLEKQFDNYSISSDFYDNIITIIFQSTAVSNLQIKNKIKSTPKEILARLSDHTRRLIDSLT